LAKHPSRSADGVVRRYDVPSDARCIAAKNSTLSRRKQRDPKCLVSQTASRGKASLELQHETSHKTPAGSAVALADGNLRERERAIEDAVAALEKFDDQTLRDLGIPHRSHIKQTVRYCHDC
jgi:hypothetical protein